MKPCPDDDTLQRFIADVLPHADGAAIESHLNDCERCRLRLDVLAGVTSVGAVLVRATLEPRVESPSLVQRMEQLQREATSFFNTPSQFLTYGTLPGALPILQPSEREGSLGQLGNLDIRRVIGRGGMGVVYEGFDPALHRTVAVKVLSPHLLGDDEAKERFLREARAAATVTHEHIVAIHAIDSHEGVPYLVLQHVDGESLAEVLAREKKLPVNEVARIGAQIAHGLAAAHERGLVHRDIKPANLLMEIDTWQVRITDFGLAKLMGGESITGVGKLAGTPAYMSPEQAAGDEVDARSDLFSLGVVLYQMATGALPFAGESPFVILSRIRTDRPKPLAEHDPSLPPWFCSIVDRLLEKDPARRLQTAAEVAELLERQAPAKPRRRLRPLALVGLVVASLATILAMVLWPREPLTSPPPPNFAPPTGVAIVGRPEVFTTLAEAVQATVDGDVIEVRGNGPFPSPRIDIRGKKLTIRAAEGSRPLFQSEAAGQHQWLVSDSDLSLIGLDVEWPSAGRMLDAETEGDSAVITVRGRATLHRCWVLGGNRVSCLAAFGGLAVSDCQFTSDKAGGRCIFWRPTDHGTISRSSFEARFGVATLAGVAPSAPQLEVAECVFRTDTAFLLVRPATFAVPLTVTARHTVFDTERFAMLFFAPTFPIARRPTATEMRTTLRKVMTWTDRECVFRRKITYLVSWAPQRPIAPGDVGSLTDWTTFWKQTDTKSIDGDLRFQPRPTGSKLPPRLDAIADPSGPIPEPFRPHVLDS